MGGKIWGQALRREAADCNLHLHKRDAYVTTKQVNFSPEARHEPVICTGMRHNRKPKTGNRKPALLWPDCPGNWSPWPGCSPTS